MWIIFALLVLLLLIATYKRKDRPDPPGEVQNVTVEINE